jgi:hypothetical protein
MDASNEKLTARIGRQSFSLYSSSQAMIASERIHFLVGLFSETVASFLFPNGSVKKKTNRLLRY